MKEGATGWVLGASGGKEAASFSRRSRQAHCEGQQSEAGAIKEFRFQVSGDAVVALERGKARDTSHKAYAQLAEYLAGKRKKFDLEVVYNHQVDDCVPRHEARGAVAPSHFASKELQNGIKLAPKGTAFQQSVWKELLKIPYGQTRSYKELAIAIGKPKAARAVGMALNKNPIPLIIPCHRVIGSNGSLTGFALGLETKRWLLEMEQKN